MSIPVPESQPPCRLVSPWPQGIMSPVVTHGQTGRQTGPILLPYLNSGYSFRVGWWALGRKESCLQSWQPGRRTGPILLPYLNLGYSFRVGWWALGRKELCLQSWQTGRQTGPILLPYLNLGYSFRVGWWALGRMELYFLWWSTKPHPPSLHHGCPSGRRGKHLQSLKWNVVIYGITRLRNLSSIF